MNNLIKQILLIIFSFLLWYFIQLIDDKKYKIKRKSIFEKYKNPLFVAALVGLILNIKIGIDIQIDSEINNVSENIKNNKYYTVSNFNREEFLLYPPPFQ